MNTETTMDELEIKINRQRSWKYQKWYFRFFDTNDEDCESAKTNLQFLQIV